MKKSIILFLALIPFWGFSQSKVAQKITSPKKVKAYYDFPGEGRKGKKGRGFSANLSLLENDIKKVAMVSFFVFDPGFTSTITVSSENLTHKTTTTYTKKRSTGAISADIAVGAFEKAYEPMKAKFKECGIELLMPWEYLDTDEKKTYYKNFKVQQEKSFSNWIQKVSSANHDMIFGAPENFTIANIVKEPFANYDKQGLFSIKKDDVTDKKVFYMNKDTRMTESLGYDLATELGVDAVIVSYITVWVPGKGKIKLENVNMQMFGPNPVMPEESSHGVIPHVKGQFYVGVRTKIEQLMYKYKKKDPSTHGYDFSGFDHIYVALAEEICAYIEKRRK